MPEFTVMEDAGGRDGLMCDHCGCEAISSEDGTYHDGDGGDVGCQTCGFPGHVSVDEGDDGGAWWSTSDTGTCDLDDCEVCGTYRGERF